MDKDYYNWVAALAVKNDEAFIALYNKFFPLVYKRIYAQIKDIPTTDDIVSEIFMKVALNLDKYDRKFAFSTWIFAIARNTMADYFRRQNRNREVCLNEFCELESPIREQPEEKIVSDETIEDLLRAMGKLAERQRKILELKYWEELANVEIAEIMNLSASNVGYIHYQAIKNLRELMTV